MIHTDDWMSLEPRARWLRGLLLAGLALSLIAVISGLLELQLIGRAATTGISDAEAAANDSRQQLIGSLQLVIYFATVVAFLMWFHRAHHNLPSLGNTDLKYSPGWAVGGFFVPFLNLVRPMQVMREIWHGSEPSNYNRDSMPGVSRVANSDATTPALVGTWWFLFLVTGILGRIILRDARGEAATIEELMASSQLMVVADAVDIPTTIVLLMLVSRITSLQIERHRRVRESFATMHEDAIAHP